MLIKKLGRGAYCSVWLCYDVYDCVYYALKIYNREDYYRAIDEIDTYKLINNYNIKNIIKYIIKFPLSEEFLKLLISDDQSINIKA